MKCGYGKLIWPDESTFEGYWINGQACGVGVFRSQEGDIFEGFWQQDKVTGLCVFRQNDENKSETDNPTSVYLGQVEHDKQNGRGIEVWSDGSYYYGNFMNGVK